MATIPLPPDFSEFLRLLNEHDVAYLLIGGYAVGYHGYVRATADIDVWVRQDKANADRIVSALQEFGFNVEPLEPSLFLKRNQIVRMGIPPFRIEIQTSIDGVEFDACYDRREIVIWGGLTVHVISRDDLIQNKRASGRLQDLSDVDYLT